MVKSSSEAGKDLPPILPALAAATITIRHGQLHLLAGQPGGGKTLLSLWYAISSGETCLYVSADSDEGTMANRSAAILLSRPVDEIKKMRQDETSDEVDVALSDLSMRLRIDTDPHPTLDGIYEEVWAYQELFGCNPSLIVVDNLLNLQSTSENEWTGLRDSMSALHGLARSTGSAVLALHHVSENESRPNHPAPRKALMGKISQLPESIFTVAMDGDNYFVAAVKNRDGITDPNAENPISVCVDAPSMSLFNSHTELQMARTRRSYR